MSGRRPSNDDIRACLDQVPDPEIPVISIMDLGVVRAWRWQPHTESTLVVTLTPTYSGCPANHMIADHIRDALQAFGIADVRIEQQLTPPWTTDWLTARGRERLRAFGIAPPVGDAACGAPSIPSTVLCPHCGASDTAMVSRFGSTPCKAQYRCHRCLEPFDYFKCY